jgi:hypothetical protein
VKLSTPAGPGFATDGELFGAPRYALERVGPEGGRFEITYWIGPDATLATRQASEFLIRNLHLPSAQPAQVRRYQDPVHRFSIDSPSTWERALQPLTSELSSPAEIFAAGTFPPRPDGNSCSNWPVNAIQDLGPTDAFVWIAEAAPGGGLPPRPARFADEQPDPQMEARFCLSDPNKPFTQWWIPFTQGNRNFYVYVAMGNDISDARRAETWNVVGSFSPESAPSISPRPEPTTSPAASVGR